MQSPNLARAALGVTIIAWSSAFAAMRIAVAGFSAPHVALLRFGSAAAVLVPVALVSGAVRVPRRDALRIAVIGVLGLGLYTVALAAGQAHLAAGTSSILIATAPIWMTVIAVAVARERTSRYSIVGLACGLAGVVAIKWSSGLGGETTAILVVLGAAMLQAAYSMAQRKLVARHGSVAFMTYAVLGAVVALLPTAGGIGSEIASASVAQLVAVVFLGFVPSAIGYVTWAYASTRVTTQEAGAALYLIPPCATAVAYGVLGEVPAPSAYIGGALVLAGVWLMRRR